MATATKTTLCAVENCDRSAQTKGWCGMHYQRARTFGSPGPAAPQRIRLLMQVRCSVEGCPEQAARRGMCQCHYQRVRKHGRADIVLAGPDVSLRPRGAGRCAHCNTSLAGMKRNAVYCGRVCKTRAATGRREVRNPQRKKDRQRRILAAGAAVVTLKDWERLKHRFDQRCAYCHRERELHMDHVVPIAKGGRHAIGNLLPACQKCNSSKRDRLFSEWRLKPGGGDCNPFLL